MLSVVIEDSHVSGHAHQREQLDVDLGQNEELVERAEDITLQRDENPFVPSAALDVLFSSGLVLLIDHEEAVEDDEARDDAEDDIAAQEQLELLASEGFIVAELVRGGQRQFFPVDQVVFAAQDDIVKVVDEDQDHQKHEIRWVDDTVAIVDEEDGDEKP